MDIRFEKEQAYFTGNSVYLELQTFPGPMVTASPHIHSVLEIIVVVEGCFDFYAGGKVFEGKNKRTATAEACRNAAQERFFHELDQPFRLWLQGLRAEDDSLKRQERVQQLRRIGRRIALNCGREMLDQVSPSAYCKRGKGEAESHSTAPEAWLLFRRAINKLIRVDAEQSSEGGADI